MQKCFSQPEAAILKFVLPIRAYATFSPRQKKMSHDFEKELLSTAEQGAHGHFVCACVIRNRISIFVCHFIVSSASREVLTDGSTLATRVHRKN